MPLTTDTVADVLRQLHEQLGDFDPDVRALVGLRVTGPDEVAMADLEVQDNGVLSVADDIDAIVVVTGDTVEVVGDDDADAEEGSDTDIRQLLAVLRDGAEVGVFRLGDDPDLYVWDTTTGDPQVDDLRPRGMEANIARRAFGLPSVIRDVPITELFSRLYLLHLAQLTLERFDDPDTMGIVSPSDIADRAEQGPFAVLLSDDAYPDDETAAARQLVSELTWEDVRRLAARGDLTIGPYRFDPEHAQWLDARGFAQYFDETVMPAEELLGALDTMGDDDLVGWAIEQLLDRDWYAPTVGIATGDLAAAAQVASNDPRYGD